MNKQNWIIGVSTSGLDGIAIYKTYGTYKQVKEYLWYMITSERNEENFDFGTESIDHIQCAGEYYMYGFNVFADYHIDYVARLENDIYCIQL